MRKISVIVLILAVVVFGIVIPTAVASQIGLDAYRARHEAGRLSVTSAHSLKGSTAGDWSRSSLDFADTKLNSDASPERFIQRAPDVAALPDGGYVVFWEDDRNGDFDIYARTYGADNQPTSAEIRLIFDDYGSDQRQPSCASDVGGDVVLAWIQSDGNVYCQVFDSNLDGITEKIRVNDNLESNDCNLPDVAFLFGGSFGVVWEDTRSTENIYCQLFTPIYESLGENFRINSPIAGAQFWAPQISSGADSGFAATWDQITGLGSDVSARTFTTGGVPKSGVVSLPDPVSAAADQFQTAVSYLAETGYVASFIDTRGESQDVYAQVFDFSGAKRGANFVISDNSDYVASDVSAASSASGEVTIVTWTSYSSRAEILGALLNNQGDRNGPNFTVSDPVVFFDRFDPQPAVLQSDSIVVVWTDLRTEEQDVYAQRLSESGDRVGDNLLVSSDGTGAQQIDPEITAFGSGVFAAVWTDERSDEGDIYMQIGLSNGSLVGPNGKINTDIDPALQQMPDVDAAAGHITVVWQDFAEMGNPGVAAIMSRKYDSDGAPLADPILLNDAAAPGERSEPSVAQAATGRATAVWTDRRNGVNDIYGQGINATGSHDGANFKINSDPSFIDNHIPSVGMTDASGLVVAWRSSVGGRDLIVFQLFDSNRDPIGSNVVVDSDSNGNDCLDFDLAVEPSTGEFVVAWLNESDSGDESVLLRRYGADGTEMSDIVTVSPSPNPGFSGISTDVDSDGNVVVAWSDYRAGTKAPYYTILRSDDAVEDIRPVLSAPAGTIDEHVSVALNSLQIFTAWASNAIPGSGFDIFANSKG